MSEEMNTEAVETAASEVAITDEMVAAYCRATNTENTPGNSEGIRGSLIELTKGRGLMTPAIVGEAPALHAVLAAWGKAHFADGSQDFELVAVSDEGVKELNEQAGISNENEAVA